MFFFNPFNQSMQSHRENFAKTRALSSKFASGMKLWVFREALVIPKKDTR
jgi:hypothetical protein